MQVGKRPTATRMAIGDSSGDKRKPGLAMARSLCAPKRQEGYKNKKFQSPPLPPRHTSRHPTTSTPLRTNDASPP